MKAKKITYTRLRNLGNYEHESLSVEVELDNSESPKEAYEKVKKFVEKRLEIEKDDDELNTSIPF